VFGSFAIIGAAGPAALSLLMTPGANLIVDINPSNVLRNCCSFGADGPAIFEHAVKVRVVKSTIVRIFMVISPVRDSFCIAILDELILNSPLVAIALRRKSANRTILGQDDIHKNAKSEVPFHFQLLTCCRKNQRAWLTISLLPESHQQACILQSSRAMTEGTVILLECRSPQNRIQSPRNGPQRPASVRVGFSGGGRTMQWLVASRR